MDGIALDAREMDQRVVAELARLESQLCHSPAILDRVWNRVFSEHERTRLTEHIAADDGQFMHPVAMWQLVRGGSPESALIRLARCVSLITQCDHDWLLESIGESTADADRPPQNAVPQWDPDTLKLTRAGIVLKHVRSRTIAANVVRVLDAFEEQGWPSRIDDPMPDGPDQMRLHATILSLNTRLSQVRFHADGSASGITWEYV